MHVGKRYSLRQEMNKLVGSLGSRLSQRTRDNMIATDRSFYCPEYPYVDSPQVIDYKSGATISF